VQRTLKAIDWDGPGTRRNALFTPDRRTAPSVIKLAIIIPFYNESGLLGRHVAELRDHLSQNSFLQQFSTTVVLVDDGSSTPPGPVPDGLVHVLLRHPINLGQGAALQTGIAWARSPALNADLFVTMDADGQHRCEDLEAILTPVTEDRADVSFGNRFIRMNHSIPPMRRRLLQAGILFERVITGLRLGDSHNGYRAFNRTVARAMDIQLNRMAHATEIKQIVARGGFRYAEVAVDIAYTEETLAKGQRNVGALIILKDLMNAYLFRRTSAR